MNVDQLKLVNDRIKHYVSKTGNLADFTKIIDNVLAKPKDILERQLPFIDAIELMRDVISLKIAIERVDGWSDTIDIITNPEEYEYLMQGEKDNVS